MESYQPLQFHLLPLLTFWSSRDPHDLPDPLSPIHTITCPSPPAPSIHHLYLQHHASLSLRLIQSRLPFNFISKTVASEVFLYSLSPQYSARMTLSACRSYPETSHKVWMCDNWRGNTLLASSGKKPGMLLTTLQCTAQLPKEKNHSVQTSVVLRLRSAALSECLSAASPPSRGLELLSLNSQSLLYRMSV